MKSMLLQLKRVGTGRPSISAKKLVPRPDDRLTKLSSHQAELIVAAIKTISA
jgi:hypothetical protein